MIIMKRRFRPFLSIFFEVLPLRAFVALVFVAVLGSLVLGLFILDQFESALTLGLKQQGILLAQSLDAGIAPHAERSDTAALQAAIDRFVAAQEHDIEVNIILLKGGKSYIVASNIADNIERTSKEEHKDLLKSLKLGKPVFFISEGEEEDEEEDEDSDKKAPSQYDFPDNRHFMSVMTPIFAGGKGLGSINVKLSLEILDQKLSSIRRSIWAATFLEIILVLAGLVSLLNYFLKEKTKLQDEEAVRLKAEIRALQSQVNPHFLFNTLNTLSNLIATDQKSAERLALNMAFLYRNIVGAGQKEWWTVADEIKIVQTYLEIESARFCDKLKYKMNVSGDVLNVRIPSLLIQPLVENSVKHSISASAAGGEIDVAVSGDQGLVISVEDRRYRSDRYPTAASPAGEKTGLESIRKRLQMLYGEKARFEFHIFEDGAKASIIITESNV